MSSPSPRTVKRIRTDFFDSLSKKCKACLALFAFKQYNKRRGIIGYEREEIVC